MQYRSGNVEFRPLISFGMKVAFGLGLILGILIGWMFSGVIGAVMKLSFTVLLLIPLVVALVFWWKVRTGSVTTRSTVVTWSTDTTHPTLDPPPDPGVIDMDELERLKRERRP